MPKRRDKNKIKQVAKIYTRNGLNMEQALKEVENGKEYKHPDYRRVKAYRWRIDEELQAEIRKEIAKFDKTLIDERYVLSCLYGIINDTESKASDKVNALSLMSKILALTKDNAQSIAIFNDRSKIEALIQKRRIEVSPNKDSIISNNNAIISTKTE